MQTMSRYRDLLWDFTYEGASKGMHRVTLRVFQGEQEMFERRGQSGSELNVSLPIERSSTDKTSRGQRSRERIPASILADLGRMLWEAIPFWPKSALLEATPDRPCRLKISGNSAVIDDLPWEWLNDGPGEPFALRPETRIARSIPIRLAIPPMTVEPPLRVLLVLTNPKDERLLAGWVEIPAVSQRLQAPPYALRVLEEPTWEALVQALREEPHIVHYIGHAGVNQGDGNLILHDLNNRTHWISGPELAQALPLSVRLLCLSTCFTAPNYQILGLPRLAHAPATYRLPTTVTNRYPVGESGVRSFWAVFYESLATHGGSVNEAFHEAQQAVAAEPGTEADWGSFSLVIRDQSGEAMRLEAGGTQSDEKYAAEIQAQLASRLANDMAERLREFGAEPADIVQRQYEETATRASDLVERYREGKQP